MIILQLFTIRCVETIKMQPHLDAVPFINENKDVKS